MKQITVTLPADDLAREIDSCLDPGCTPLADDFGANGNVQLFTGQQTSEVTIRLISPST